MEWTEGNGRKEGQMEWNGMEWNGMEGMENRATPTNPIQQLKLALHITSRTSQHIFQR